MTFGYTISELLELHNDDKGDEAYEIRKKYKIEYEIEKPNP